jgi:hypothetical protein
VPPTIKTFLQGKAMQDLTSKGKETALNIIGNSAESVKTAQTLIVRFRGSDDTYSRGIVQACQEWLKKGNA